MPGGCPRRAATRTLEQLLAERGVEAVMYAGWEAIDALERSRGEPQGRPRIKLCTWDELLAAARARPWRLWTNRARSRHTSRARP